MDANKLPRFTTGLLNRWSKILLLLHGIINVDLYNFKNTLFISEQTDQVVLSCQ